MTSPSTCRATASRATGVRRQCIPFCRIDRHIVLAPIRHHPPPSCPGALTLSGVPMRPHIRCSLFGFGAIGVVNSASGSSAIALRDVPQTGTGCRKKSHGLPRNRGRIRYGPPASASRSHPERNGRYGAHTSGQGTAHRRTARGPRRPRRNGSHAAGIPSLGPVRRLTPASIRSTKTASNRPSRNRRA